MNARTFCQILLVLLLLARSCISIALEPIVTYNEAGSIDLRTKDCSITVTNPETISDVVNTAQPGDVICLLPGVTYPALLLVENATRAGTTDYIIIRVADTSLLPPPGIRISSAYEGDLPKIAAQTTIRGDVHHIVFLGIDFFAQTEVGYNIILLNTSTTISPHHIIVDQCLFRNSLRLVGAYNIVGRYIALLNSHLYGLTAASVIIGGSSAIKIQNNNFDVELQFLSVTENTSSDIEIRYNRFVKRGLGINYFGAVLNSFERVLIENNYFSPSNADEGIMSDIVLFLSAPGPCYQRDFIFRNNWVDTFGRGFGFYALANWTGSVATEFSIYNNFLKDGQLVFPVQTGTAINITQNTILNYGTGNYITSIFGDVESISCIYERNIIEAGEYGIVTPNFTPAEEFLGAQKWTWQDNLVISTTYLKNYPNNTLVESNMTDVGFIDLEHDNYNLLPSSKYNVENYGKQLGVDICKLINTAKLNVIVPGCVFESVELQPNEIIEITTNITINGNLTMYPNSTLQVPFNDGKINISNCATFAGILNLLNTTNVENGTEVALAYYACYNGGEFDEVSLVDPSDQCLLKYVNLTYAPTSLTALITSVNVCNTPNAPNDPNAPGAQFPDWAIAVIVVGGCLVLVAIFIIVAVTVPALHAKVFPYAKRSSAVKS